MKIRDRIKELRRVAADELVPNPRNWRKHPRRQQAALRAVLDEVGYADALLARELPDGRLELIDGHLRAETTPDMLVPVLVLDVNEAEADKILLTLDPLSAMAKADQAKLDALLRRASSGQPQVQELLAEVADSAGLYQTAQPLFDEPRLPELFQVIVECGDQDQQQIVFEQMREEGYRCRVLTL